MPGRGRGRGGFRHDTLPRTVLVSKALSRLLRHAAVDERIPIDNHGYVRMDHLLGWQKLRSMKPPVTFAEVVEVVQESDKKRFAMKYVNPDASVQVIEADSKTSPEPQTETTQAGTETETQRAISTFESLGNADEADTRRFFIRATQGHSMKAVEAENLLTPISLSDPATIPDTVVHGTFYGAWDRILRSGGLKSMARNHVHFASGPSLAEVLPAASSFAAAADDDDVGNGTGDKPDDTDDLGNGNGHDGKRPAATARPKHKPGTPPLGALLGRNKVISGMRSDAQILIYVDIRKALAEAPTMKWWRSENGVILSEGVVAAGANEEKEEEEEEEHATATTEKLVPIEYFVAAVEVKQGLGLLWEAGRGSVRELPEKLRTRGLPRGKGEGPRGRGRGRGKERIA
ncbi:hypothetical protein AYL99_10974 [Fonsecaea erecta]|uniref:2'-phosphotransferase n=1 Tax=Fonsecaea erecta TaxID=1367422 RepID=A0A178Z4Y1_9EURO|nr:hypothetical protein AYL99_10974 [Fonsecaea erecta]OAP54526.1 hypothetical protein AYL99_10974 [Fonsecaea erecta]